MLTGSHLDKMSLQLMHEIGQKSANLENQIPYKWAKGYMPNLRRDMVQLTETYGVVPLNLAYFGVH